MDLNEARRKQAELQRSIDAMLRSFIDETGLIPVIEIHCQPMQGIGVPATYIPVVHIQSVLPESHH